jgi:lipid biosynthesis B12-binding/radical SAM protein
MSRVFFISANSRVEPYPVYPLGMAVCSAALVEEGHQVRQFDYLAAGQSEGKLISGLKKSPPDFVCLSVRNIDNIDSYTSDVEWYLDGYKRLVEIAHQFTQAPVIVGGPAFSIMPEKILEYIGADYGVRGEGERALGELIGKLEKGEGVKQITSAADTPLHGREMVSPLYDKELVDFYFNASGVFGLQTKRGCPYHCTYCTYPFIEGHEFRPRDPRAVVDDIERIKLDFNAQDFFFTDSVFNDSLGYHIEVTEEMIRRQVNIHWAGFFTPRNSVASELALMKRSGLYAVELGTDAGSDRTLAGIGKEFTFSSVINFNNACVENEIPCCHYIIFGGPNENESTIIESLANIEKLKHCVVLGFSGIRILPGTILHRQTIEAGIIDAADPLLKPKYYFSPDIAHDRMNCMLVEGFKGRRDRIFPPEECSAQIAVVKNFGIKGILWDKLIRFPGKRKRNA